MKKAFIFIIVCLFIQCKSQFNFTPGANNHNPDIDKFVGTWGWSEGGKSLEIILKKENILLPIQGNVRADVLSGFHKYTDNNLVVENSTQYSSTVYMDKKNTILGYTINDPNKLLGEITHISKNKKNVKFTIEYIDINHIKLLKFKNPPGVKVNISGQPSYDSTISLPQNIILIRQ